MILLRWQVEAFTAVLGAARAGLSFSLGPARMFRNTFGGGLPQHPTDRVQVPLSCPFPWEGGAFWGAGRNATAPLDVRAPVMNRGTAPTLAGSPFHSSRPNRPLRIG